jgi:hypothetical protein
MDPDTVITLGSLVHDLLGLVGGIILCYFGYRLMLRRIKAYPRADRKWDWNTAKILFKNTVPGTMFALLGAVAIWLTAAKGIHPEGSASVSAVSSPTSLPVTKNGDDFPIVMTLNAGALMPVRESRNTMPERLPDSTSSSVLAGAPGLADRTKLTPDRKSAEVAASETAGREPQETGSRPKAKAKTAHKDLEKQRLAAERKRARLEAMYQKGTITSEAYKSGENEYRIAIQRYRTEANADRVDEN